MYREAFRRLIEKGCTIFTHPTGEPPWPHVKDKGGGVATPCSFIIQIKHISRVKLSKFGHTFANSVNPDETAPYKPSRQNFHCLLS